MRGAAADDGADDDRPDSQVHAVAVLREVVGLGGRHDDRRQPVIEELVVVERVGVALRAGPREKAVLEAAISFEVREVGGQPPLERREHGDVDVGLDDQRSEACGPHETPVM
jgi:hypothetical protein